MHIYGLANTTPEQMLLWMLKKKIISDVSEVAVIPMNARLKRKQPARYFLFSTSIDSVRRNLELLNSKAYEDVCVFLFGSPLMLSNVRTLVPLDYEASKLSPVVYEYHDIAYRLFKTTAQKQSQPCTFKRQDYLTKLTDSVKVGSLLNPLMTFIYTLPSSTHQTPVKNAVAMYLYDGLSMQRLYQLFDDIPATVTERVRLRIREILESEVGQNYKQAFKTYHKQGLEAACSTHTVNAYEMSYLLNVVESLR